MQSPEAIPPEGATDVKVEAGEANKQEKGKAAASAGDDNAKD